jgi:PAS domain S-box-containing protein
MNGRDSISTVQREAQVRLLLEQLPAILWTTDRDLRFTSLTGAALAALPLVAEGLLGTGLDKDPQGPFNTPQAIAAHREALAGRPANLELEWGGHIFEAHIEPLRDASGDMNGCVGVALDISKRRRAEEAREEANRSLSERVKELSLLHQVSSLLQDERRPFDETMADIVALLPSGWQYPEVAVARLVVDGREYTTPGFVAPAWSLRIDRLLAYDKGLQIEVGYVEERPVATGGPFLAEERRLLDSVGEMLSAYLERRAAEEALRRAHADLERRVQERTAALARAKENLESEVRGRAAAEVSLQQERDFANAVLDTAGALVVVLDRAGRIVRFNRACEGLTRYAFSEVEGRPFWEFLLVPEEAERVRAGFDALLAGQFPNSFENYWLDRDGGRHLIAWANTGLVDARGQVEYLVATGLDITDHRQAEEALRIALEKYRVLFESFPLGITISDEAGNIVETNKESERLLGISRSEHTRRGIASPAWQIVRPDGRPMPSTEYPSVRALQEARLIENVGMGIVKEGGEVTWINVTAAPIPLEGYGVAVTYGDVTAQKQAEEALRENEAKFRSLYTAMTEGVALHQVHYDGQGHPVDYTIMDVNPAFERVTGIPREQAVGQRAASLYGTPEAPYLERYAQVAETGEPISFETYFAPMGKHFRISVFSPLKGQFATVFADIGERKQAEETLDRRVRERTAELAQANASLQAEVQERKRAEEAVGKERQRFIGVLETLPAYVVLLTPDYHASFANRVFRERFGEAHGRRCYEFLFERTTPCEHCETYSVLDTRAPHRWQWTGPDGRDYDVYDFPFTDTDGSSLILEMGIDITERNRAERALRELNETLEQHVADRTVELREARDYLDNLLTFANAPIVVWDPEFKITRFNGAFERLTGREAAEVMGKGLEILFPEDRKQDAMEQIRRTASGERWEVVEIPIRHVDGTVRTLLWNSATLYDADGVTPVATITQGQDITLLKYTEERLRHRNYSLRQLNLLSQELNAAMELPQLLQRMSHAARDVLAADGSIIWLWDRERPGWLVCSAVSYLEQAQCPDDLHIRPGEGLAGWAAQNRQSLVVNHPISDPRFRHAVDVPGDLAVSSIVAVPLLARDNLLGVLEVVAQREDAFDAEGVALIETLAGAAATAVENIYLHEQARQAAVVSERSRLARELHDAVSQTLFSASMIAESLPRLWERKPERVRQGLEELHLLTRGALSEMRTLLLELRPSALAEGQMGDLLQQLTAAFDSRSRIAVAVAIESRRELPPNIKIALYRMAQDALNNVVKHARATRVEVNLRDRGEQVELVIHDNGRGFDPRHIPPDRLGLGILQERADAAGATLSISSQPGHGTEIRVRWPAETGE